MGTRCFFIEPSGDTRLYLRRYVAHDSGGACAVSGSGIHNARNSWRVEPDVIADVIERGLPPGRNHAGWPEACACGYHFTPADVWQVFSDPVMRRTDTGETMQFREAPPGAMWYADWMLIEGSDFCRGPDGHCLVVRLPNGNDWMIDARSSNCTLPDDDGHKCWVRHGAPPNITVDKNGRTCAAGAGSIASGDYHGFLTGGELQS